MKKISSIIVIILCFIALMLVALASRAQIISTEGDLGKKFKREASFSIDKTGGTAEDFTTYSGAINMKHQIDSSLFILLSSAKHFQTENVSITDWFTQLRYNNVSHKYVYPEVFLQFSGSQSQNIELRSLVGAGSRYNLGKYLCLGTSMMYENVQMIDTVDHEFVRMNAYLRYTRMFESFGVNAVGYYQPYVMDLSDANISFITRFDFKVKDWLTFFISGTLAYSKYPYSPTINNSVWTTSNGVALSF